MIEAAFIFSAAMLISGAFRLFPLTWGRGVDLPPVIPFWSVGPTHFLIYYPSLMFQIWFWVNYIGLF